MNWLAIDVGGANLKAADGLGFAASDPFPLWRAPQHLSQRLNALFEAAPQFDRLAVTMTGELADCFDSSADGVRTIAAAAVDAAQGRPALFYRTDGALASLDQVEAAPLAAAASNWHALASFAARYCRDRPGLLVDVGSTTVDLIPIVDGKPYPTGRTDVDRLVGGELVYSGVQRTPIAAVVASLPLDRREVPVASEWFADTGDAYLLLDCLAEDVSNCETADRRPRSRRDARRRLARMVCCDAETVSLDEAKLMARAVESAQLNQLQRAAQQVLAALPAPAETFVLSGQGEFLARCLAQRVAPHARVHSLSHQLGAEVSRCAPAHALAVLAREGDAS